MCSSSDICSLSYINELLCDIFHFHLLICSNVIPSTILILGIRINSTLGFNDNILKVGIPEINRISIIARKYLIDYYSECETLYLNGVKEVLKSVPATAASAASGASGSSGAAAS